MYSVGLSVSFVKWTLRNEEKRSNVSCFQFLIIEAKFGTNHRAGQSP